MKHGKKIAALLILSLIVSVFTGTYQNVKAAGTSEFKQYSIISNKCIMLEFSDGGITYANGSKNIKESISKNPLTVANVATAGNYSLKSSDDANYSASISPLSVNRKSKGNATGLTSTIVQEHFIYLNFATPLSENKNYVLTINNVNLNCNVTNISISTNGLHRTDAIHVNQEGFLPKDSAKYAYISSWNGDGGPADLSYYEGKPFNLINTTTNTIAYSGTITKRAKATDIDTLRTDNMDSKMYQRNYVVSDVFECNFSSFANESGLDNFIISVPGIGCSYPFNISVHAYDNAFYTTAKGIYQQRNGIALESRYTKWDRPTNYDPNTTSFRVHYGSPSGSTTKMKNFWGWYADAGDLDGYPKHMNVARYLMTIFEMQSNKFVDNTLNIPESGDGIPDILDEAGWLVNFGKRVRTTTPTGGVTLRVYNATSTSTLDGGTPTKAGGAWNLVPSWQDTSTWWCVEENATDTYIYAAAAAQYAYCLSLSGASSATVGVWLGEAKTAYAWAKKNGGAEQSTQFMAASWVYKATNEQAYLDDIKQLWDVSSSQKGSVQQALLSYSFTIPNYAQWGVYACATNTSNGMDNTIKNLCKAVIKSIADGQNRFSNSGKLNSANTSGGTTMREAIYEWMPQVNGTNTTPHVLESILAYEIYGTEKYIQTVQTTADYMLGGNGLNQVWVTGLGENPVAQVFKIDEHNKINSTSQEDFQAGIVPYGCTTQYMDSATSFGGGCYSTYLGWNSDIYPTKDKWPMHEGWFNNRYAISSNEFTIWENLAPSTAVYAYLSVVNKSASDIVRPTAAPTMGSTAKPTVTPTPRPVKKIVLKKISIKKLTTKTTKISGTTTAKAKIKIMYKKKIIKSSTASSKGKFTISKLKFKKYKGKTLVLLITKSGYKSYKKEFAKIKK